MKNRLDVRSSSYKKSRHCGGGERGGHISTEKHHHVMSLIAEACNAGARKRLDCDLIGISVRTLQRWRKKEQGDQRKNRSFITANKLNEKERQKNTEISIRVPTRYSKTANSRLSLSIGRLWASLAPRGAVSTLAATMPASAPMFTYPIE